MPTDKKQVKLGDKVTVTVQPKRKRRQAAARTPDERRYGPPPFPDDDERLPPRPQTVYLLDGQTGYNPARTVTDRWYKPEEVMFPDLGGFVDVGEVAPATRYGGIIGTAFYDPVFIENTFKIDVKNPNTGNVFKRIFYVAPLTKTKCDDLGMSVVLGSKEYEISSINPKYQANKTPEQRLDAVNAQIALGSTPELIEKRDNILLEIEELLTADYAEPLRWDNEYREFAVPEAFLRAEANGKAWEVKTTGIFFEPFNAFDTENFKVTENSFSDDEVAAPKLNGKDVAYVLLAPQNWLCTATRDTFNRGGDNVVRKRHEILYQYVPAITKPFQARTITVFSSYARAFYPTPPTQYDPLRLEQTVSYVVGGFERITPPVADGFALGPDSTPQRSVIAGHGFNFSFSTGVKLISNCHNRVEQGNSNIEKYCGSFIFKEKIYNVFRKTERVAISPVLIYDGRVDSLENGGATLLTGESYDYSYFDTAFPGHTNSDLGTFTTDLRP
jgi:hypothetical protein